MSPAERRIDELLEGFGFDDPWDSWMLRVREVERSRPLGSIGPYEILGEVGRGGQGVVYKAHFTGSGEVFALKRLIAGSLAGPESRARLERELEAASILDSSNIVKVFGIDTVDEQPLLAMEWIDGRPITAWAGRGGVDGAAVLRLFRAVCAAVHHAHQRGVLHRDLKPSNILVDRADQPRLLDFGLAKLMDPDAEGLTCSDMFLGTPAYAAPEQLSSANRYADVRSDVYSLGVILRELVTGAAPGRGSGARSGDAPEAEARVVGADRSGSRLHPDLEAIILRATAAEPARRYQSAAEFEEDIGRLCAGEPVWARRPGRIDAIGRFVRRHRFAVLIAGIGVALLLGWGVVAGAFAARLAARSRDIDAARRTADSINNFLQEVLASPRPAKAGAEASVLSVLELASKRVDTDSTLDAAARAGVHAALGRTFDALVRPCEAEPELTAAANLYRELGAGAQERLARTLIELSGVLAEMKRPESVAVALEGLNLLERAHGGGSGQAAEARMALGAATWRSTARVDEAEQLMRGALRTLDASKPADDPVLAQHHATLGEFLLARGRNEEARPELERACRTLRRFASSESEFAQSLAETLDLYTRDLLALGLPADARSVLDERRPLEQRLFGGTREAYWYWQLAEAEAGLGMSGPAFDHANASLAASWRTPEVPTDEWEGAPDDSALWSGEPLRDGAGAYAVRVDHALQRQGRWRAERAEQLTWFARVCAEAGRAEEAAALRDRAVAIGHAG